MSYRILTGDTIEQMATLPAESAQTCVTSPPYWGLRDYGVEGQIGLEATPDEYAGKFATFPPALVEPCILAGCPEGGAVLDPFMGSGTTLMVAQRHRRDSIGIELSPEYVEIAKRRIDAPPKPAPKPKPKPEPEPRSCTDGLDLFEGIDP